MGADQLGWFYFNGQLRYKDGHGWTDRYKPIEGPGVKPPASKGKPSDDTCAGQAPSVGEPPRRKPHLVTAVCAGLLGLGLGLGGSLLKPDVIHGSFSWAGSQVGEVSALFSAKAPSTPVSLAGAKAKVTPDRPVANSTASVPRDVNAFAPGGPFPATMPASYDHPSHSDCLKLRDQVRAWSDFQNAHRPKGFSHDLPSSGDVQYLRKACGLSY